MDTDKLSKVKLGEKLSQLLRQRLLDCVQIWWSFIKSQAIVYTVHVQGQRLKVMHGHRLNG